jgi:hypothetical protein
VTQPNGAPARRRYYSERQGRGKSSRLTPAQARRLFASLVAQCEERGEWQEAFGYWCVDASDLVPGSLGGAIPERLLLELGRENVWPVGDDALGWDDDTFFDMIEFLYDHVSTGDQSAGRYHSYSDCGWHFEKFSPEPGRSEYRRQVNEILRRIDPGYELSDAGEIVRAVPDGVAPLLETAGRRLESSQKAHLEAAITKYRARGSTPTDRRDAVRDLADVLENLRAQVKDVMSSKDEAALFQIANQFWIRHNKPAERRDYDHEAWWAWLFYVYLASIALVTHVHERDQGK